MTSVNRDKFEKRKKHITKRRSVYPKGNFIVFTGRVRTYSRAFFDSPSLSLSSKVVSFFPSPATVKRYIRSVDSSRKSTRISLVTSVARFAKYPGTSNKGYLEFHQTYVSSKAGSSGKVRERRVKNLNRRACIPREIPLRRARFNFPRCAAVNSRHLPGNQHIQRMHVYMYIYIRIHPS